MEVFFNFPLELAVLFRNFCPIKLLGARLYIYWIKDFNHVLKLAVFHCLERTMCLHKCIIIVMTFLMSVLTRLLFLSEEVLLRKSLGERSAVEGQTFSFPPVFGD